MSSPNYFKIIGNNKALIFICAVLCGLLALLFSALKPVSYEASIDFSIQKVNRQDTSDFQYDNYYAIQASELLGNTIVGWLESPETVRAAYRVADLTVADNELDTLAKGMKAKQISAHLVRVKFSQSDSDRAGQVATGLSTVVKQKAEEVEKSADDKNSFTVSYTEPVVAEKKYGPATLALAGLVSGLLLGIGIAFGREYFKK